MSESKNVNRRDFIKYAASAIGGLIVGGALGYLLTPRAPAAVKTVTSTITSISTVTKTVTQAVKTTPTTKPPTEKRVIRVLAWETTIDDLYKKLIKESFTPQTGIEVEYSTLPWTTYVQKNLLAMKGEAPYDVISNNTEWTLPAWVYADKLLPLNDFIERDFKIDDFLTGFLGICAYPPGMKVKPTGYYLNFEDAVFYGVPYWADSQVLLYRNDLIETPPKTPEELVELAKKLTKPEENFYGFCLQGAAPGGNDLYDSWYSWLHGWGAEVLDENLDPAFNTPEGIEASQWVVDLYRKHKVIPPDFIHWTGSQSWDAYKTEMVAMLVFWGNTPIPPDLPVAKKTSYSLVPVKKRICTRTAGAAFTIPKTCKDPEAAWEYIKWALSPEVRRILVAELGAPCVFKHEIDWVKEGWNAWAVANTVLREDIGVSPAIPNLPEVCDAIQKWLSRALLGEISVKEALSKAEPAVKEVMKPIKEEIGL